MNKKVITFIGSVFLFLAATSYAQSNFPPNCTTTEKIHFMQNVRIPPPLNREQTREAILVALGYVDVNISWSRDAFTGQWFFEYEDEFALYAGYSVRSHYLQVALLIDEGKVTSIVCDSRNLRQKTKSIHKKVPLWKGTLDDNIRIALGQAVQYYQNLPANEQEEEMASQLKNLNSLHRSGVLTNDEYRKLKQRVIGDQ